MYQTIRQAYRHLVQQQIVRREMRSVRTRRQNAFWETGGMTALFSAAAACGLLAQAHLG